jgi:hypothetical protein
MELLIGRLRLLETQEPTEVVASSLILLLLKAAVALASL